MHMHESCKLSTEQVLCLVVLNLRFLVMCYQPSDTIPQTTLPNVSLPEPASNDSNPSPAHLAPTGISEDQKLRMEANRLKALERAKARLAAPIAT